MFFFAFLYFFAFLFAFLCLYLFCTSCTTLIVIIIAYHQREIENVRGKGKLLLLKRSHAQQPVRRSDLLDTHFYGLYLLVCHYKYSSVTYSSYLMLKNMTLNVTLKSSSEITQSHLKWHQLVNRIWVFIRLSVAVAISCILYLKTANRAFSAAAPRAWKQLPTELKRTQSTSAFRRGLKTLLFNRAHCSE